MFDDKPDEPHDRQGEGNYFEIRAEFDVTVDDDGDESATAAQVHTHCHHVPTPSVVDTLLMVIIGMVKDSVSETTFAEGVPDFVREGMGRAFATMWIKARLDSLAQDGSVMEHISIPDDASELLGD